MRLFSILSILIVTYAKIYGQTENVSSNDLDSLYIKTISSQHLFLINGIIYVETNEITERIENVKELGYLKFMTTDELIKESLKTKMNLKVIRVAHKFISNDTIDINIGYLDVKAKRRLHIQNGIKFIKADFKLYCGGTNGYIPTCRFIYDKSRSDWKLLANNN